MDNFTFQGDSSDGLEGNIAIPKSMTNSHSTIDEPITATIIRDLNAVGKKLKYVLLPWKGLDLLKDWDLWGPFAIFIILALVLQVSNGNTSDGGAPEFAQVFTLFCLGAVVVSLNAKLLGGTLSFFQTVCVLGYCILPLVIGLTLNCIIKFALPISMGVLVGRLILVFGGLVYSIFASVVFIRPSQSADRVALAVYPACLFYVFIGWLVFINTGSVRS